MEESNLRKSLAALVIILSIITGFMKSSIFWGIGAFFVLNLVIAPIISVLEKRNK